MNKEQLIQKLRNELLSGPDSMAAEGTKDCDELFDSFRKLCHGMSRDEIDATYKEIIPIYEQLERTSDKAINTFDAISKLYVAFLYYKAEDKKEFDFYKELPKAYIYVYSQLYMATLLEFYQRGSAIEYSESLDKEQEDLKWFALTLDRCGFKYFTIYETNPGTIILRGEKYYVLTEIKPRSVKYPKVTNHIVKYQKITNRVSGLSIGYDMFTLKFKEWKD